MRCGCDTETDKMGARGAYGYIFARTCHGGKTRKKVNGHGGAQVRYDKHFGHAWGSYGRG